MSDKPHIPHLLQPQEASLNFCDYLDNASTCCTHAQMAADQGRYRAAHGLFQTAITFYDNAQELALSKDSNQTESPIVWQQRLQAARQQIEECATHIYQAPTLDTHQAILEGAEDKDLEATGDMETENQAPKRLLALVEPTPSQRPEWNEQSRAQLQDFIGRVANTPLKVKILQLFLNDPGLCLSSYYLADQFGAPIHSVRQAARELCEAGSFNYCSHFAFTDLCNLSLAHITEETRQKLDLLQFALRQAPEWVWEQVDKRQKSSYY